MARKVTRREVKNREKAKEKAKRKCKEQTVEDDIAKPRKKKTEPTTDPRFVAVDETTASALLYAAEIAHMKAQQGNCKKNHNNNSIVKQAKPKTPPPPEPPTVENITDDLAVLSLNDQEMYFKPIPQTIRQAAARKLEEPLRVSPNRAASLRQEIESLLAQSATATLNDRIKELEEKANHFNEQVKVTTSALAKSNTDPHPPKAEISCVQPGQASSPSIPSHAFPFLQANDKTPRFDIALRDNDDLAFRPESELELAIPSISKPLVRNIEPQAASTIKTSPSASLQSAEQYKDFYSLKPFNFNYIEIDADPSLLKLTPYTRFCASFATSSHIYVFYTPTSASHLCLGRYCTVTYTWEPLTLNSHTSMVRPFFCSQVGTSRTAIVCSRTELYSLDLDALTFTKVSLPPEATIYPGFKRHSLPHPDYPRFIYASAALDHNHEHVYLYVRAQVTLTDFLGSLSIYRLDWRTKLWTKIVNGKTLELMGFTNDGMARIWKPACLAFTNGALYLVVKPFPSRLIRINPLTHDWIAFTLQSTCHYQTLNRQKSKWIQAGSNLYVVNYNIDASQQEPTADLWSFNLATFTLKCHQREAVLSTLPSHSYLLCAKETEGLWLLPKTTEIGTVLLTGYHIPLGIPSLHSLARGAFLHQAPIDLEYSMHILADHSIEYRRQPLTIGRITEYFQARDPDIIKAFKFSPSLQ